MYLLDTDTLSYLWQGTPSVKERLLDVDETEVGISVVTECEIMRVRCDNVLKGNDSQQILQAQQRLLRTQSLLSELIVVPFDRAAAAQFDRLTSIRSLRKIGRADLLIACISIANRATLVTRNIRHFQRVPGLLLENWVD